MPKVDNTLIGEIKQISTMTGTPTISDHWKECDGSAVNDAASPYNGIRLYNLNGANVSFSVTWTADVGGAYATIVDADINALNVGDSVTGTGITNVNGLPPKIIDITGNTVTIADTAANGVIADTTFTNDGVYLGGGSGGSVADEMQQITGDTTSALNRNLFQTATGALVGQGSETNRYQESSVAGGVYRSINFDSAQSLAEGGARTGSRTHPHTRFVKMVMRIK